jgi:alpha/beta superfamily hydrolase
MIKYCFYQYLEPFPMLFIYRVLTVHGSMDKVVPVEDAMEFAKVISNHKLHIIEGADHEYTSHQDELASVVLNFVRTHVPRDGDTSEQLPLRTRVRSIHSRL